MIKSIYENILAKSRSDETVKAAYTEYVIRNLHQAIVITINLPYIIWKLFSVGGLLVIQARQLIDDTNAKIAVMTHSTMIAQKCSSQNRMIRKSWNVDGANH